MEWAIHPEQHVPHPHPPLFFKSEQLFFLRWGLSYIGWDGWGGNKLKGRPPGLLKLYLRHWFHPIHIPSYRLPTSLYWWTSPSLRSLYCLRSLHFTPHQPHPHHSPPTLYVIGLTPIENRYVFLSYSIVHHGDCFIVLLSFSNVLALFSFLLPQQEGYRHTQSFFGQ